MLIPLFVSVCPSISDQRQRKVVFKRGHIGFGDAGELGGGEMEVLRHRFVRTCFVALNGPLRRIVYRFAVSIAVGPSLAGTTANWNHSPFRSFRETVHLCIAYCQSK
jgi:hypothetical protein